jgi:hypothetical protein
MIRSRPYQHPWIVEKKLSIEDGEPLGDIGQYQRLMKKLF